MKETLNKVFGSKFIKSLTVLVVSALVFDFLIFPGLTTANTIINIASVLLMLINMVFLFYFFKLDSIFFNEIEVEVDPGETELDYIPPTETKVKVRKKRGTVLTDEEKTKIVNTIKQKGLYSESDEKSKPKTKRKSKVTKSEFPLPPHNPRPKTTKNTSNSNVKNK